MVVGVVVGRVEAVVDEHKGVGTFELEVGQRTADKGAVGSCKAAVVEVRVVQVAHSVKEVRECFPA